MEHFDDFSNNRGKEKNVYLLHLDATRIVIITCALLGVIIIAFLIGMNFSPEERNDHHGTITNEALLAPLPDDPIRTPNETHTPIPNESDVPEKTSSETATAVLNPEHNAHTSAHSSPQKNSTANSEKLTTHHHDKEGQDLFAQGNGSETVPPAKTTPSEQKTKPLPQASRVKKSADKYQQEKNTSRHRTVEVASKPHRTHIAPKEGFSIQVASYASRTKALQEVNRLKEHRYDPFIEATHINGRNFFRVKIGPLSTRKEAEKILEELKEMNRYDHSYITRE
ncbi:MAG: SPOR domain-containing protein [Spirochaetes bacterium]|nr:SPOR domain-containing protein [Spirochaetota bacterium]